MTMTPTQEASLLVSMTKVAGESLSGRQIGTAFYFFGSELACLRVFANYNAYGAGHNEKVRTGYSKNLKTHYVSIELGQ